jgi:RNA polymerase sigma-70 factor (ECF subfamily)
VGLEDAENQLADSGVRDFVKQGADDALLGNSSLKHIFETLSRDQRDTLRLFFVEGYTLTEIAAKLNQTHANVKHHYFRGLEKLRKHLFDSKLRCSSAV